MAIPGYEDKEAYTRDEVEHIVARRVMSHRLEDLERAIKEQAQTAARLGEHFDSAMERLEYLITNRNDECRSQREELRREIHEAYATRTELKTLESKVDGVVPRLLLGMGLIVGAGMVASMILLRVFIL